MPRTPELADLFKASAAAIKGGLHTALPGVVEDYDPATQTVSVTPTVLNPIYDPNTGDPDSEQLPTIPNVPVAFPRGGGYCMTFPLKKGDHVILIFSELATAQWRQSGGISEPIDVRRHSLGYPFAIPGAFPDSKALLSPVFPLFDGYMTFGKDGDPTGTIRVKQGSVECGGLVPVPVAMATPAIAGLQAIMGAMTGMQAALDALSAAATAAGVGAVALDGGKVAFGLFAASLTTMSTAIGTAITAANAALTSAVGAIPATITKGQ